jgi:hypothetical protein
MPTAEKHLLDNFNVAGRELEMDSKLEVASGACRPIGGAYHGLTPSQHSLRMLDAVHESRHRPSDRLVLWLQWNASSYSDKDAGGSEFFCCSELVSRFALDRHVAIQSHSDKAAPLPCPDQGLNYLGSIE